MNTMMSVGVVLAGLATLAACEKVAGRVEPAPRPVRVQAIGPAPGPAALKYSATLQADRVVAVAFKASGFVDTIPQRRGADGRSRALEVGDAVHAGDLLAQVRGDDYQERINQAELPPSLPRTTRLVSDWAGVLAALGESHPRGGTVAVFPCGAIQVAARD